MQCGQIGRKALLLHVVSSHYSIHWKYIEDNPVFLNTKSDLQANFISLLSDNSCHLTNTVIPNFVEDYIINYNFTSENDGDLCELMIEVWWHVHKLLDNPELRELIATPHVFFEFELALMTVIAQKTHMAALYRAQVSNIDELSTEPFSDYSSDELE